MAKRKVSKYKGDIVLWCNYPSAPFEPTQTIPPVEGIHDWIDENFFNKLGLDKWRDEFSKANESWSTLSLDKIRYDIGALLFMANEGGLLVQDDKDRNCMKIDLTKYTGLTRPTDQLKLSDIMVEILTLPCMKKTVLHVFTNDERFPNTLRYTAFKDPEFLGKATIVAPKSSKIDRKEISMPMILGLTKDGRYYDTKKCGSPENAQPVEFPDGFFDTQLSRLLEMA